MNFLKNNKSDILDILIIIIWALLLFLIFWFSRERKPEPTITATPERTMFQEAYDLADYCGELTELSELLDCVDKLQTKQKEIENFWIL